MKVCTFLSAATLCYAAAATPSHPKLALEASITLEAGHAQAALLMPVLAPTHSVSVTAVSKNDNVAISHVSKAIAVGDQSGVFIPIFGRNPGSTTVNVTLDSQHKDLSGWQEIRVEVIRSASFIPWITGLGWLCFFLWSSSFYPQVFENQRRNSVIGLNLDSALWNMAGNFSYLLYNMSMYFSADVFGLYQSEHPGSPNPVTLSDVFFTLHASAVTAYIMWQVFRYDRGSQRIANISWVGTFTLLAVAVIGGPIATAGHVNLLRFLEFFSTVKLVCTFLRYTPQVVFNWQRQSTEGFAVGTQLLDLIGGFASILQMFLQAYNSDNYGVFGNFAKFGLALISIGFDVTLIVQHMYYMHNTTRRYPHYVRGDLANPSSGSDSETEYIRAVDDKDVKKNPSSEAQGLLPQRSGTYSVQSNHRSYDAV